MTRQEYLDAICKIVSIAVRAVGKIEAKNWLEESEEVVSHPWIDSQEMCLQILEHSPHWHAFYFQLDDECAPLETWGDSFARMLENFACAAMYADCGDIIDRIVAADARLAEAKKVLEEAAQHLENVEAEIGSARVALENDILEAEAAAAAAEDADEDEPEDEPPAAS